MMTEPQIIFEDEALLVIAKPPGLVVNRAETVGEQTLQDWVERTSINFQFSIFNEIEKTFVQRSGIAHRLDKETSGVMVIGKTPASLANLMQQFKARETRKEYQALVHGTVEPRENVINLPIGRNPYNRHRFQVDVFGKPAVTRYQVEQYLKVEAYQDGFTLLRLFPKTGRTHQIRVHLSHLGYPLVGDEVYGGRKRTERDRQWCPRHFLHAAALELSHPVSGERMKFEAPLPEDLNQALQYVTGMS